MATPAKYVHYQQKLEGIAVTSDLVRLDMDLNELKRQKASLELTSPVHEKHKIMLEEWIEDLETKINMTERMLSTLKLLIHEQLKFIPNTLQYSHSGQFFCKVITPNETPSLAIGNILTKEVTIVTAVRELKFYLATHEDDF